MLRWARRRCVMGLIIWLIGSLSEGLFGMYLGLIEANYSGAQSIACGYVETGVDGQVSYFTC